MATKKKVKATKKAKPAARKPSRRPRARPCVPPEICAYLEELKVWFTWFHTDYTALRIAMCNVEAQAFSGAGLAGKRFPPCGGGPGGDPIPPPAPPVWD